MHTPIRRGTETRGAPARAALPACTRLRDDGGARGRRAPPPSTGSGVRRAAPRLPRGGQQGAAGRRQAGCACAAPLPAAGTPHARARGSLERAGAPRAWRRRSTASTPAWCPYSVSTYARSASDQSLTVRSSDALNSSCVPSRNASPVTASLCPGKPCRAHGRNAHGLSAAQTRLGRCRQTPAIREATPRHQNIQPHRTGRAPRRAGTRSAPARARRPASRAARAACHGRARPPPVGAPDPGAHRPAGEAAARSADRSAARQPAVPSCNSLIKMCPPAARQGTSGNQGNPSLP